MRCHLCEKTETRDRQVNDCGQCEKPTCSDCATIDCGGGYDGNGLTQWDCEKCLHPEAFDANEDYNDFVSFFTAENVAELGA